MLIYCAKFYKCLLFPHGRKAKCIRLFWRPERKIHGRPKGRWEDDIITCSVTRDRVWIGNWIYRTLTTRDYKVIITFSLIYALYTSIQHAPNLLRLRYALLSSGFQRWGLLRLRQGATVSQQPQNRTGLTSSDSARTAWKTPAATITLLLLSCIRCRANVKQYS
jgi:hypothetical protein